MNEHVGPGRSYVCMYAWMYVWMYNQLTVHLHANRAERDNHQNQSRTRNGDIHNTTNELLDVKVIDQWTPFPFSVRPYPRHESPGTPRFQRCNNPLPRPGSLGISPGNRILSAARSSRYKYLCKTCGVGFRDQRSRLDCGSCQCACS